MQHIALKNGWRLNLLSSRVATITHGNTRQCAYFGFNTKKAALSFCKTITARKLCLQCEVRKGRRLQTDWEVKVWGCSTQLILALAQRETAAA
jgi:hypothetical protein